MSRKRPNRNLADPHADSAAFDPVQVLDRLIYFSEDPVDTPSVCALLGCRHQDAPPTHCAAFDFAALPRSRYLEVVAWGRQLAERRVETFQRVQIVTALPQMVYWFGWTKRGAVGGETDFATAMVKLVDTAGRVRLPRPLVGVSATSGDWADLRRSLTRATVGCRLARVEGRPYGTTEEVERYLAAPRPAPRTTTALVAAVVRGDSAAVRAEAQRVAESYLATFISPLATLRTRLLATSLQCGEAAQAAGLTEHVVTRWVDHRLREFWQLYSLPLLAEAFTENLAELATLAAETADAALPRAVAGARSLLMGTWNENYPAMYLAREVGLSVGQLSRQFRQALGCSIPQFRNRLRMERAAEMLRAGEKPITSVALECGYSNLTHFHRVFTRQFGRSPMAFREAT